MVGLEPGTIDWSIKDAHIYVNQVDGIKEQIRRIDEEGDLPAPKLFVTSHSLLHTQLGSTAVSR